MAETRHERLKSFPVFSIACCREGAISPAMKSAHRGDDVLSPGGNTRKLEGGFQRAISPAMKSAHRGDDVLSPGGNTRKLEGGFHSLRPGIAQKDSVQAIHE